MEILVRQSLATDNPDAFFTDRALDTTHLRIGSAADADVQLGGNGIQAYHAEIQRSRGKLQIVCSRGSTVNVNGKAGRKFNLSSGDSIAIGDHVLDVLEPPAGFDLALSVGTASEQASTFEGAYQTDLRQTRLQPRMLAWILSLTVLGIAMLIPLAYHFLSRSQIDPGSSLGAWLIDDTIWSSGPLHEAHASLDNNCKSCHVRLFQRVSNESCNDCHEDTQDHIVAVDENNHLPIAINDRCASCHREHNEPVSSLTIDAVSLCTDCHGKHKLQTGESTIAEVADFAEDLHPAFSVSLTTAPAAGSFDKADTWPIRRVALTDADENSQLKFNHEVHIDKSRVTLNSGDAPGCTDCHRLNADGEHFGSINFESDCASSGCHQLELDPRNRLPHGQPNIAIAAIEGYYLRKFGNPDQPAGAASVARRRRLDQASDEEKCTASAWQCAMQLAARKVEQQFTKTGCITCHNIEDTGGETLERFRVAVVKLTTDYHPAARFDHNSHGIIVESNGDSAAGDDACEFCHAAAQSEKSSDLLLPAIDNCTTCHNGPQREHNVPLGCIDCHAYHPAS